MATTVRHGLNRDLGFSPADRSENIRRVGEVAHLMNDAGLIVIAAFISPCREDREIARAAIAAACFIEVHVSTPLSVCEARDPKGMYRRARAGEITGFTGIDAPYDAPDNPELRLDLSLMTTGAAVQRVLEAIGLDGDRFAAPARGA